MIQSPVMVVVEVVAALTTVIFLRDLVTGGAGLGFTFQIILWLWFTVLFANFAEAVAEGRGKAQAESLRKTRTESQAKLLSGSERTYRLVSGTSLKVGDIVLVEAGDNIPSDGEVIEGVASVNEAAITGESAPVIRESGGDRSAVTGGTQELADAAQLAELADETPEGRSIVVLAKEEYGIRGREIAELGATFIPFTAQTRMSGVDAGGSSVRKGAVEAILNYVEGGSP